MVFASGLTLVKEATSCGTGEEVVRLTTLLVRYGLVEALERPGCKAASPTAAVCVGAAYGGFSRAFFSLSFDWCRCWVR